MTHSEEIALYVFIFILVVIGIFAVVYFIYILRKLSKTFDKVNFLVDDWIYKSELLNPPLESAKKLLNYVDVFDLFVKKNLKAGISLAKRNNFLVYRIIANLKDLIKDDADFKTTPKKEKK